MNELAFGSVYGDYFDGATSAYYNLGVGAVRPSTDYAWDADRARACVCDAGWTGINCASRMCPWGNDVMDTRLNRNNAVVYQVQTVTLYSGGTDGGQALTTTTPTEDFTATGYMDFDSKSFALRFTSKTNETYTTVPIELKSSADHATALSTSATGLSTLNTDVKAALEALPNRVITGVTVTSSAFQKDIGMGMALQITFDGDSVHGQQNLLEVVTNPCADGCTPKIDGLTNLVSNTNTTSNVRETTAADYNSFECGRRGKCDYETGLCACFEGYTGEACTSLTALI
jgi:hypothetical protein